MADIRPVTFGSHASKRWQRFTSYNFARELTAAPLVLSEMRRAAAALPIAFVKRDSDCYPVALLGLDAQTNAFVGETGEWLGVYVPAALRVYPFSLGSTPQGETLLCVDEDSGLVSNTEAGLAFFGEDGKLAPEITQVASFVAKLAQDRSPTLGACGALEVAGVLEPWQVAVRAGEREWRLDSLLRVNEEKLNALPANAFVALRESGALAIAYAHLHSVEQMQGLASLALRKAVPATA